MSVRLSDGTVVPSFLGEFVTDPVLYEDGSHSNFALRVGEIIAATDGGDNGHFIQQYTVRVYQQNEKRAATPVNYYNCTVMSMFGGSADYTRWTLRPAIPVAGSPTSSTGFTNGDQVLLLCINGRTTNAWILGGVVQTPNSTTAGTPQDTPIGTDTGNPQLTYTFVYNGTNININPDGEYTITVNGPTDIQGDPTSNQTPVIIKANTSSNILLQSEGVLTGDATDATVLGTTYINDEADALNQFIENMQQVAADLATAGSGLMTVAPPAGAALTKASADLLAALEPLSNFTSNSDNYLSKKNKSD